MTAYDYRTTPTPMPRIGAANIFADGTLTVSAGTGSACVDWRMDNVWISGTGEQTIAVALSGTTAADYVFIAGHNLAGGSFKFQRWTGSAWADIFDPISVANNNPIWVSFQTQLSTNYRLVINPATGVTGRVAILAAGVALELEQGLQDGFSLPGASMSSDAIDSVSESGYLIGRTLLDRPDSTTIEFAPFSRGWYVANILPLRKRLIQKPWAFAWNPGQVDAGSTLAWCDGVPGPDAYSGLKRIKMSWKINMLPRV